MNIKLSQIYVYPIKSLAGIKLNEGQLTKRGLHLDRRWVLVDADNKLITQRGYPTLCLLQQAITETGIHIYNRNKPDQQIIIPFEHTGTEIQEVDIWDNICQGVSVNDKVDAFFSDYLQMPCKLLFQPDNLERVLNKTNAADGHQTTFTDGYPYMILSEASLQDLNKRIGGNSDEGLKMNRFRPNFVVKGCDPYAEDTWKKFQLGNIVFHQAKPCVRCSMTTIEQETAQKHKAQEPLRTLQTYRRWGKEGVIFGMNIAAENTGDLRIGDELSIMQPQ